MALQEPGDGKPWRRALRRRLAYGLGDAGFNLYYITAESFLFFFYTDVFRLPLYALTRVILAGRTSDVIAGVLVGVCADRWRSRFGRYRPYLLWFALPLFASFVLLLTAPVLFSFKVAAHPILLASAASVMFAACYSAANGPYTALLTVMSPRAEERAAISATRFAIASMAVFVVQLGTFPLVRALGGPAMPIAWQRLALLYGAGGAALVLTCFSQTQEISDLAETPPASPPQAIFRLPEWYLLSGAMVCALAGLSSRASLSIFFVQSILKRSDAAGLFLASGSAAAVVACVVFPMFPQALRHRNLAACLCVAGAVISALFLLVRIGDPAPIYLLQALFGLTTGVVVALLFSAFADLAEHQSQFHSKRLNGILAASALIMVKCGTALGGAIVSFALQALRYQPGIIPAVAGHANLRNCFALVPAILLSLAALLLHVSLRMREQS